MKKGTEYEKLAQHVYNQIINRDSVMNIRVQHDVTLKGKTTEHQIDVYWEFSLGGFTCKTVIQAKDWKNRVPQVEMLAFKAILDDLPSRTKGVFVTKTGYQKGAIDVATSNGISIHILRKPLENDWEGRVKDLEMHMNYLFPVYENLSIDVDGKWLISNGINPEDIAKKIAVSGDTIIYDGENNEVAQLSEIILSLCKKNGQDVKQLYYECTEESYITTEENQKIKFSRIGGLFGYNIYEDVFKIKGDNTIGLILRDVVTGEINRFNKNHEILGGVKNE